MENLKKIEEICLFLRKNDMEQDYFERSYFLVFNEKPTQEQIARFDQFWEDLDSEEESSYEEEESYSYDEEEENDE